MLDRALDVDAEIMHAVCRHVREVRPVSVLTRIVLCDDNDGPSIEAAFRLGGLDAVEELCKAWPA